MRFFFVGLIIIFLVSLLVGQLATPKRTPFRRVFAQGMYYTILGLIGFGVIVALAAIIYNTAARKGSDTEFSKMTNEQRDVVRDSLRSELPDPSMSEIKTKFIDFNFETTLIPCYETVHKLDVASLEEIESLEIIGAGTSKGFYEIQLRVNEPVRGFHLKGNFLVQYAFEEGDSDFDPGWKFHKILIGDCEVLAAEGEEKKPGKEELYPDLPRE